MFGLHLSRVLLLHAHPDDETLATGGTIATLAGAGVEVVLLTATRGEQGEVVPGVLAAEPDQDLASVRLAELTEAADLIGVSRWYLLGQPPARVAGRAPRIYRDSGMRWDEKGLAAPAADVAADSLTSAPLAEVAADVRALVDSALPDLIVSDDAGGGYGHPDHRLLHRVALAVGGAVRVPVAEIVAEAQAGEPDVEAVDVRPELPRVRRALRAYRTQLTVLDEDRIRHVGGQLQQIADTEYLRLLRPW